MSSTSIDIHLYGGQSIGDESNRKEPDRLTVPDRDRRWGIHRSVGRGPVIAEVTRHRLRRPHRERKSTRFWSGLWDAMQRTFTQCPGEKHERVPRRFLAAPGLRAIR